MIGETGKVVIIDYQLGNLFSVQQACIHIGLIPEITNDKETIINAKAIILPGVGAFGNAMKNLEKFDLVMPLKELAASRKPIFGICLGMQLLFEESEEFGKNKGLGIIAGTIRSFPINYEGKKIKVPHIGWNTIYNNNREWKGTPLEKTKQNEFMYFVHSYYAQPSKIDSILTFTDYCNINYCSSIISENVFATQFHPEKSSLKGLEIYREWANYVKNLVR